MIQDIYPHVLKNEFINKTRPNDEDRIMIFNDDTVLANIIETNATKTGIISFPSFKELKENNIEKICSYRYLFRVDEQNFYLGIPKQPIELKQYPYTSIQMFRKIKPMEMAYAGTTSYHLYQWYRDNQFCGRCGNQLEHAHNERMMFCEKCKNTVYPRISPSVIVGIIHEDKILVTRYAKGRNNYRKYALVAGFTEIGETAEETVKREVMEETGLKVKNIRYYKSQPWGFTGGLLLGYWAELDGDDTIHLDEMELCEGRWIKREELELDTSVISLTREMMKCFKDGKTDRY